MKRILKQRLEITDLPQTLEAPAGARIVSFYSQEGHPCIWLEVDPNVVHTETRDLRIIATGVVFEDWLEYIATAHVPELHLVLHLCQTKPVPT